MGQHGDDADSWSRRDDRLLHARLLDRDPAAPAELAERFLPPLVAWLHRAFRKDDPLLLETIAVDLILSLGERPEQYDPDRLPLTSYLHMAARGDVRNAREREQTQFRKLARLDDVELSPSGRNTLREHASDPADAVADAHGGERVDALLDQFVGLDREVVELIVDGERRTERYAEVLGIQGQPWDEQLREVKRAKDRLKGRMKRVWKRMDDDD
ncbi:MAG: hypothetical protein U0893_10390 [Chloroflexota bacterium]